MRPALVMALAVTAWAALVVACDPGTNVTVQNATGTTLTFFFELDEDAVVEFTLGPFDTGTFTVIRDVWKDRLIARDPSGEVVFDERITWDELEAMDRIVVESNR